jgi:hypothetical protein
MDQGHIGAMTGEMAGPYDGIMRAESGGMQPGGNPLADLLAKLAPSLAQLLGGGIAPK